MEFLELIEKLESKLTYLVVRMKEDNNHFDEYDLLQEIYLYLWTEWENGNLKDKNENYILKGCYFYLKNFLRKNRDGKTLSLEEMQEKYNFSERLEFQESHYIIDYEKIYGILNERERKVLDLLLEDYTTREIGKILGISHVMVIKVKNKIKKKINGIKK